MYALFDYGFTVKVTIEKQINLYLLQDSMSPFEFTKAVGMMEHPLVTSLHPENVKKVAELIFADWRGKLQSFKSIEEFVTDVFIPYLEPILQFGREINQATLSEQLAERLREWKEQGMDLAVAEEDVESVARRIFLKKTIAPYRSVKRLEQDILRAREDDLVTEEQLEKHFYFNEGKAGISLELVEKERDGESVGKSRVYVRDQEAEFTSVIDVVIV